VIQRPSVSPLVLAEVIDRLPGRLRRRLEQEPELASGWSWNDMAVSAEGDAVVTLAAPVITSIEQVRCTCLLAPKCLHIAAVLRVLPVDLSVEQSAPDDELAEAPEEAIALDDKQRDAAGRMWSAGAAVLVGGAGAAGLVVEGELLRAIHSCRLVGLHRLAAAGLRVVERIRALRAQRPEFRLELLASDMHELLATAHALAGDRAGPEWIGTARREYTTVGSLKLAGIFTEPIIAATGYAGVVTYFVDSIGGLWSLSDVAPGDGGRCQSSYRSAVAIGDVSLPHQLLGRRGLLLQAATASRDRRLGSGKSVAAVVSNANEWTAQPLAGMFARPLADQLDSAWNVSERHTGSDLLFIRGKIAGARDNALLIETADGVLGAFAPSDHEALAYRDNMRLLGSIPNLELLAIGRILFEHPASVALLAVALGGSSLPDQWSGRVNLGLDVLTRGLLPAAELQASPGELAMRSSDATQPLDAIRRRLLQVLMGGTPAVSPVAWTGIERDESMLVTCNLATGGRILAALRSCGADDRPRLERQNRLARAWLAASTYEQSAKAHVQRLTWLS